MHRAVLPCPACGCAESAALDGYLIEHAHVQLRNMVIGGDYRTFCGATGCGQCGYLAQLVFGVLSGDDA